jgi:TonB-linked SusC/RagA family outer membrane protein
MKKILLVSFFVSLVFTGWAQERTVTGTVTSAEDGSPLPGVNVLLKGTTTGTATDVNGSYSILAPSSGGTLVFTFIGYQTREIEIGSQSTINVAMESDVTQLTEVVVSALGIDRAAREIVYANQTVSADKLLTTPNKNTLEALRGKTAGVRLSTGSGSVGASTRIVLRGEGSLTGNNNALIVVDGIPINNESTRAGEGTSTAGYADHGNRFNDINPDDIESVTILKGPSATSLFGSRGASGVVMITTKKGRAVGDKKMEISLNSSYSREKAYVLLKRQDRFGQGYDAAHFDSGENWSWGPEFDGVVRPWTSPVDADGDGSLEALVRPYRAVPDQLQEFFNFGNTFTNSVSLSGANDAFTYYASYSNLDQKGILDNTWYKRNTVTFNATAKLSEKWRSDFKISYANTHQNTAQEGSRAFEGNNAWAMAVQSPVNIPFGELRDYNSPFHDIDGYWGSYSSVNPYYILNEYGNEGKINNFLGNASVTYTVIDGLDLVGRFGANVVNTHVDTWTPRFTPKQQIIWGDDLSQTPRNTKHSSVGEYESYFKQNSNLDLSFMANYTKQLNELFTLNVSAGYNWFQTQLETLTGTTSGGLVVSGVYNLSNSVQAARSDAEREKYRIFGVLGNARLGFKDAVFLELSARNDWSSTLPPQHNSFFYSAAGISAIITDLVPSIQNNVLSYLKVRTSYGTTGKDAGLYLLNSYYVGNPTIQALGDYTLFFPFNGRPGFTTGDRIGNPGLKPELTTTYEVGADIGLFDERVNLSYTYYHSDHSDQIVQISLPRSSGFTNTVSNIGSMINKGHEVTLSLRPIDGMIDGLEWELFGTFSKNENEVVKIADGIDELGVGGPYTTDITVIARKGLPFGTYKGLAPKTNAQGQVIVDPNTGYPLYTDDEVFLGSYQPDYLAGFGTNINYKGIGFNILFDVRQGGKFVSQTKFFTEFNGTALHTVQYNREPFIFPNAVIDNGDGTFRPNDIEITEQDYFTSYNPSAATFLVDASFVKLREIGLSYTLPNTLLDATPFTRARIALFAKNLKFWLPSENIFADPEVNGPDLIGNSQGIETTQVPPSKSFGVNLQLTF